MSIKIYNVEHQEHKELQKDVLTVAKTKKTIDLLEINPLFISQIVNIRKKFRIPPNGFPKTNKMHKDEKKLYNDASFRNAVGRLLIKMSLPWYWLDSTCVFALRNAFLTPTKEQIKMNFPIQWRNKAEPSPLKLAIYEKLSKNEFHKLIDEKWDEISRRMDGLPHTESHKMSSIDLAKKIVEMKDIQRKTFKKIADELSLDEKYSEILDSINDDNIKQKYYRYKRMVLKK